MNDKPSRAEIKSLIKNLAEEVGHVSGVFEGIAAVSSTVEVDAQFLVALAKWALAADDALNQAEAHMDKARLAP